jgi:X-X-X-Leu-X-X-Gly heptad repeat protein
MKRSRILTVGLAAAVCVALLGIPYLSGAGEAGHVTPLVASAEGSGQDVLLIASDEGNGQGTLPVSDTEGTGQGTLPVSDTEGDGQDALPLSDAEGDGRDALPLSDAEGDGQDALPLSDAERDGQDAETAAAGDAIVKSKEEVVYAALSPDGLVRSVYAVNQFDVGQSGRITDYGDYDSVVNLTDTGRITQSGDAVSLSANEESYYYQGNMATTDLPWIFSITYSLDGATIAPQDLADKSGTLEMRISSKRNEKIDPTFYDNDMLQITATLDMEKCDGIDAPDGTLANAGKNKIIAFTVLPGNDADFYIKTTVRDFAMAGIEISAMPFTTSMEFPETDGKFDDLDKLPDATEELNDGVAELEDGARDAENGAAKLVSSSDKIRKGLSSLRKSSKKLTKASKQIGDALSQISGSLDGYAPEKMDPELAARLAGLSAGLTELSKNYADFHKGLVRYTDGVNDMAAGYKPFHSGLASFSSGMDELHDGITELHDGTDTLNEEIADVPDQIKAEIEEMKEEYMPSDFEPVSFTSPKNTDTAFVQFILKSDGIEPPEEAGETEKPAVRESFLDRLTALFQ